MLLKNICRNTSILLLVSNFLVENSMFAMNADQEDHESATHPGEYRFLRKHELKDLDINVYGDSNPKLLFLATAKDWQKLTQEDIIAILKPNSSLDDRLKAFNWLRNKRYQVEDTPNQYIHNISNLARLLLWWEDPHSEDMATACVQKPLDYNQLFKHLSARGRKINLHGIKKMIVKNNESEKLYGHLARVEEFLLLEERDTQKCNSYSQIDPAYKWQKSILDTYYMAFEKTHSLLPLVRCVALLESGQYSLGEYDLNREFIEKCRISYARINKKNSEISQKVIRDQPGMTSPTLLPKALGASSFLSSDVLDLNQYQFCGVYVEELRMSFIEDDVLESTNFDDYSTKCSTQETCYLSEDEPLYLDEDGSTATGSSVQYRENGIETIKAADIHHEATVLTLTNPVVPSRSMREPDLYIKSPSKKTVFKSLKPRDKIWKVLNEKRRSK